MKQSSLFFTGMPTDLPIIREIAQEAALKAGKLLNDRLGKKMGISYKGEIDLVTEMDCASEKLIIDIIRRAFPDAEILAEEEGALGEHSESRWIIDPLDGTTNYAHGYPVFCVSIGYEREGELLYGVVYDPTRDELFAAEKGQGATLNGNPIQVSDTAELDKSLLCTGFPYDIRHASLTNIDFFSEMVLHAQAVRRDGAAALDLCYAAMGRFDGFWEFKLKPWDMAAGVLIVREAGGEVSLINTGEFNIYQQEVLASNGRIHQAMRNVLENILSSGKKVDIIKRKERE
jgi:myo-inositol-1(or 4)-monophosphatase